MKMRPSDESYREAASALVSGNNFKCAVSQWAEVQRVEDGAYVEITVFVPRDMCNEPLKEGERQ